MKTRIINYKLKIRNWFFILLFSFIIYHLSFIISALAQTQNCGGGTPARATGLVTTPSRTGKFGTSGACIDSDPKVAFAPFKIPDYATLKSIYFDQSKQTKETKANLPGNLTGNNIYLITSELTINANLTGSGTHVIFTDKLNINKNIIFSDPNGGLVFITKDDVIIDKSVTQIDAVIISSGTIYTAGTGCTSTTPVTTSALTINGSLISLNAEKPIHFCRNLANNNNPAEIINAQPKYLVILRDLMSDTLQKWSEIP